MIEIMAQEAFDRVNLILSGVPGGAEKALQAIITRARSTVRSTALENITKVYDIKAKDVRDRQNTTINMYTRKAEGGIVGTVSFSGSKIPLYRFGVKPKNPKSLGYYVPVKFGDKWVIVRPSVPVKARLRRDKPMTLFNNDFIASMKSTHTGIFHRENRDANRMPIHERMGLSTAQMAVNEDILKKVETATLDTIQKRAEHEINRILHGYGGK